MPTPHRAEDKTRRRSWALVCALSLGCARAPEVHEPTLSELGIEATSSVGPERMAEGLPALPVPLARTSTPFQRLYEGIELALSDPMPEPDVSSEAAYRRYVDGELAEWLANRSERLASATARLRALRGQTESEWIVGHALVGFLYDLTASDVIDAPVPGERLRPERARLLRDAWRERLAPLRERAAEHFGTCLAAGETAPIEAGPWVALCRRHEQTLAPPLRAPETPHEAP